MKSNKKIVFYTIYKEKNNDLQLISQCDSLEEISKKLNIKKSTLKSEISQKNKIKDLYFIYKDYILENEII